MKLKEKWYENTKMEIAFLSYLYDKYVINYDDDCGYPVCLEEFYNNEYIEFYKENISNLDNDFSYVDIDEENKITEDFYIWSKGTDEQVILNFIERRIKL